VEVDDHAIRIIGDKATLEQLVAGHASTAAVFAVLSGSGAPVGIKLRTPILLK
jgi:hypothetical protein